MSSIEVSASLPAVIGSVAAKSFRFVGATRIRHARQGGLSRRRSGGPAPGPTYLARQTRVPAESHFTTSERILSRTRNKLIPLLKATAGASDECGCTTPVALRGKHRAVHPLQYSAELKRVHRTGRHK